jgi:methylated-DNA-[protein]-cysteine S-methyltransferase
MNAIYFSEVDSPLGTLLLLGDGFILTGLYMENQKYRPALPEACMRDDSRFRDVREQLHAYFAGKLKRFSLPIAHHGTAFQQRVWQGLCEISYGEQETYGGLARRIGSSQASRAVGLANGRNPIGIIVPCHRVLGADGTLTGYGGGLARKRWLLDHERRFS